MAGKDCLHTMSSEAMKAVFNNLTSGASRRAKQGYNTDSATHREADSIMVNMRSARLSTKMHVTDWAKAQCEDPEIEATMDWCHLDKKKSEPWTEQLAKLKSRLGSKKNTQREGAYCGTLINSHCREDCYTTGTNLSTKLRK